MAEHPHDEVRRLFDLVLDVPAAQRTAVLERECAGDAGLRQRILAMVAAAEDERFLGEATGDSTRSRPSSNAHEHEGTALGRYKLLQPIGEGGFGTVWMADQREPVKRRVALKIIKLGMDTRQVIARFEAERQALAMMDHPNIAKVFDAGSTESGRPYFVMEYIKGVPIIEYCDTARLDTRTRLELFIQVCHAIQHAHQKGIIHRDIKPTNVLVTLHDGVPVPKVIDFGIAKATNAELTEKTLFTQHRQMVGTPAYMSPEQAEMSGLDIDTRSDVYSMGVLLYELLTGTTPFDVASLLESGFEEMMRVIREEEPHKPSTRLSTLGETATRMAQLRRADVHKLGTLLRGDLDWIVMKCLEKERARRYETANGLAADIRRHLSDEPVTAGPPSTGYRLRKFVRRNRTQVVAGAVVTAALVLGVVGTSAGLVWALREKDRADGEAENARLAAQAEEGAKLEAQASERKAKDEAVRAEHELARATETKKFITDMLGAVDPEVAQGRDTTVMREILDRAVERLEAGEIEDELIEAELRYTIGATFQGLGEYALAEPHLRAALAIRRRVLGDDHPDTIVSVSKLGVLLKQQGKLDEAESYLRETLDAARRVFGDDHPNTLTSFGNLGSLLADQGKLDEAEPYLRDALDGARRILGDDHPDTLRSLNNLGLVLLAQDKLDEAEPYFRDALDGARRVFGDDHPNTFSSINNLGLVLQAQGKGDEAEPYLRDALDRARRVFGDDHPNTLKAVGNLASLFQKQGKFDEAEPYVREALDGDLRVLGNDHRQTLNSVARLGWLLQAQGKLDQAVSTCRDGVERARRALGEHPTTAALEQNLAGALRLAQRPDEAAAHARHAVELYRAHPEWSLTEAAHAERMLVQALTDAGLGSELAAELQLAVDRLYARTPADSAVRASHLAALATDVQSFDGDAKVRAITLDAAREAAAIRADLYADPEHASHWLLHNARSLLGGALLAQARHIERDDDLAALLEEAEPLVVGSAEWLLAHPGRVPENGQIRIGEAVQRVVDLYTFAHEREPEAGYEVRAAEWKAKLPQEPDGHEGDGR